MNVKVKADIGSLKSRLAILEAFDRGETIQMRVRGQKEWVSRLMCPDFENSHLEYRIAPKRKFFIPKAGTRVLRQFGEEIREMAFVRIFPARHEKPRLHMVFNEESKSDYLIAPTSASWALGEEIPFNEEIEPFGPNMLYSFRFTDVLTDCEWVEK